MSKILIIDDDEEIRVFFRLALTRHQFEVIEATGGLAGVKLARTDHPDLILCDLNMVDVDGYGVISLLRLHPSTAGIPVILITGDPNLEGMRKGMSLGADDYLAKPVRLDDLLSAVRIRLEKQKNTRESAEQRAEELRSNLLYMMPHELLTPLTGILGVAHAMKSDAEKLAPAEIREFGGYLQDSGERMHRLVQKFLTCMQIEVMANEPAKLAAPATEECVDIAFFLDSVATATAAGHSRRGDLAVGMISAQVAMSQDFLKTVLQELIENAFKFSSAGTPVNIRAEAGDRFVRLEIQDQGIGMTEEHVSKVSAFMQFDRNLHEQQGTGLGLYIAKRIVEIHGGRFALQSEKGVGTTVSLEIPKP